MLVAVGEVVGASVVEVVVGALVVEVVSSVVVYGEEPCDADSSNKFLR